MDVVDNLSKYLDIAKNSFDEAWLKHEYEKINKYYNTDKNTIVLGPIEDYANSLALLLYQAEKNISERKTNSKIFITNETVDTIRLGTYIETLKNSNTAGLAEKLEELKIADKNNFEKIINELDFASGFVKSNHTVEFIKTRSDQSQRTPDLLVDKNIEIECKKKNKLTDRD
ncbi:MAG: hypothetical protein ACREAE_03195, partial [Nitrosopumilaceae archaeon]